MKTSIILSIAALTLMGTSSSFAAPPEAPTAMPMPMTAPTPMSDHGAQMHAMMAKAEQAKTPAERSKLMAENMAMMRVHMAEMSAMMKDKPLAMPMPASGPMAMDAAHMEKMGKHMAMMHQMMESLMVQQQMMMKSGK
jgi:hypothetical protein